VQGTKRKRTNENKLLNGRFAREKVIHEPASQSKMSLITFIALYTFDDSDCVYSTTLLKVSGVFEESRTVIVMPSLR
jgi:hypothetical protein